MIAFLSFMLLLGLTPTEAFLRNIYTRLQQHPTGHPLHGRKNSASTQVDVSMCRNPHLAGLGAHVVYVLESRYTFYIGETKFFNRRMAEHFDDEVHGSDWTNERIPQYVADCFWSQDRWDEGKTTEQYMSLYGITATQGGAHVGDQLDEQYRRFLLKAERGRQEVCFSCGLKKHPWRPCRYNDRQSIEVDLATLTPAEAKDAVNAEEMFWPNVEPRQYQPRCRRCGRAEHKAGSCGETIHILGHPLLVYDTENISNKKRRL